MQKVTLPILAAAALAAAVPAHAAPGLDEVVYGATVDPGVTELEARYGRLTDGDADGENALVLEASHGFSSRFYGATLAIFEREPGEARKLGAVALEGIAPLGRIKPLGLDTALYVEIEKPVHDAAKLESKLLLEKRKSAFDSRLNLIGERSFESGAPVEFRYAASADVAVAENVRLGAEAFGELGSSEEVTTHGEHYVGPALTAELEHVGSGALELRAGYLFALGRARDESDGQFRLGLAFEFGDHDED
jgi:hypothetical protein